MDVESGNKHFCLSSGRGSCPLKPNNLSKSVTALRGWMQGTMRCQVEFPQWESHCLSSPGAESSGEEGRGGGP